MATSQGQDILRCHLCPDPVEHHCNNCRVNLCSNCILKHIKDKSKSHEIVEFMNRIEEPLPYCNSHDKKLCKMYCNDCQEPACEECITTTHKHHEIVEFMKRNETPSLPNCKSHDKAPCKMYCNDCKEPACVQCIKTTHKNHDISDIVVVIKNLRRRIHANAEKLQNILQPQ